MFISFFINSNELSLIPPLRQISIINSFFWMEIESLGEVK